MNKRKLIIASLATVSLSSFILVSGQNKAKAATVDQKVPKVKTPIEKAQDNVAVAQKNYDKAVNDAKSVKKDLDVAQKNQTAAQKAVDAQQKLIDDASAGQTVAQNNVVDKQAALDKANNQKTNNASLGEQITQKKMEVSNLSNKAAQATNAKSAAQQTATVAKQNAQTADNAVTSAKAAQTKAKNDLKTAQDAANLTDLIAAKNKAQQESDAANQAYTQAQNDLATSQVALTNAKKKLADLKKNSALVQEQGENNAVGLFKSVINSNTASPAQKADAQKALDIITGAADHQKPDWYSQAVKLDDPADAASLINVKKALDFLDKVNAVRIRYNLPEYQISLSDIASAILNADYNAENQLSHPHALVHTKYHYNAENLSWTSGSNIKPLEGWMEEEQKFKDLVALHPDYVKYRTNGAAMQNEHPTEFLEVGHYLNIINPNLKTFGMAIRASKLKGTIVAQDLSYNDKGSYSVAEFKALVNNYNPNAAAIEQAQKNLDDIQNKLVQDLAKRVITENAASQAQGKLEDATKALNDATTPEKQAALKKAQDKLDQANNALNAAKAKQTEAKTALKQANDNLAQKTADANKAAKKLTDAKLSLKQLQAAKKDPAVLDKAISDAQKALDQAKGKLEFAKTKVADTQKALEPLKTKLADAQAITKKKQQVYDAAKKVQDTAQTKLVSAKAALYNLEHPEELESNSVATPNVISDYVALNGVVKVINVPQEGVLVYTTPQSAPTSESLSLNSRWKVFGYVKVNGNTWYNVGRNQWIKAANVKLENANEVIDETPVTDTGYVARLFNNPNYKVALWSSNGQLAGYLPTNSNWKVFAKKIINGQLMYRLGNQNQWIAAKYIALGQSEQTLKAIGYIPVLHNNPNYKVAMLNSEGKFTGYLPTNSNWKIFAQKKINGQLMYRLGNQSQWVPAKYIEVR